MIPLETLIAFAALTAPVDSPADPPSCFSESLRAVGVCLEIMDPREVRYFFMDRSCFQSDERHLEMQRCDLQTMRERWAELRDAPPLCDESRFPGREFCRQMMDWNRAYLGWLNRHKQLYPREEWIDEALSECETLWHVWSLAEDLHFDSYYVQVRRRALMGIRDMVGPQMYYGGFLPPPVPVWRMWRAD